MYGTGKMYYHFITMKASMPYVPKDSGLLLRRFYDRQSAERRWMPTVAAVRACKAASGRGAGIYSAGTPEAERGAVVGERQTAVV